MEKPGQEFLFSKKKTQVVSNQIKECLTLLELMKYKLK